MTPPQQMILWTLRIDRWCDPFEEDQPDVVSGVHVVLCKRVGQIREKEKERERERACTTATRNVLGWPRRVGLGMSGSCSLPCDLSTGQHLQQQT